MSDTAHNTPAEELSSADLTVDELAALESGTAGPLSPLFARLDVVTTGVLCVVSAALAAFMPDLVTSGGILISRSYSTMSPSLIPRLAFGGLAVVAAIAMIAAYRRLPDAQAEAPADEFDRMRRAGIVAVIILIYALTVTWLGFILSTMIVAGLTAFFLGLRNPLAFVPMVVVVPVVIRFVFERLLLISLPRSEIESVGHIEDVVIQFLARHLLT